jgi:DNA (cytosine-5)-methyltransferase 1
MTFGSVFAGIGGFDLGLEHAGMCCQWQIEIDAYAVRVLAKHWPGVKRYGDVRTVFGYDAESSRFFNVPAAVDLVCGGFPCQDVSTAGGGIGIIGTRSGLWSELARLVADLRPPFVLVENVPSLRGRGLALVLQDLWALGYDAEWHCIPASAFGANHERDRIWIIGYPAGRFREPIIQAVPDLNGTGCGDRGRSFGPGETHDAGTFVRTARPTLLRSEEGNADAALAYADLPRLEEQERCDEKKQPSAVGSVAEPLVRAAIARGERHAWTVEPGVVRMVHGVPDRVDRIKTLGNAVVPQVVEWLGRRILERC